MTIASLLLLVGAASVHAQNITLLLNSQTIDQADNTPLLLWNGDVGSAATTGNSPTFLTSSNVNGPGVRFDAVNDGMLTTLTQTAGEYSIFSVYADSSAVTNSTARRVLNGTPNNWLVGPYTGFHSHYSDNAFVTFPGPSSTTTPALTTALNDGAMAAFFVDGMDETDNSGLVGYFGTLGLGTGGQSTTEPADSDLGLVLAFDQALTEDQRIGVEFIIAENFDLMGFSATEDQIAQGNQLLAGTSLIAAVPEPSSIALWGVIGCVLAGFGFYRARRRKRQH